MSSGKDSATGQGKPVSSQKKFAGRAGRKPATSPAAPAPAQAAAPRPVTAARSIAFDILERIAAGKGHCDELLQERLVWPLSQEDRNLATALVMGVLRWQIRLDALVQPLLARPSQKLPEPVAIALRMGAFQLLYMDRIPAHAAISESVELCRAADQPHATGMVNAVLRKIALMPKASQSAPPETRTLKATPTATQIAARFAHPLWLVERWVAAYGPANAAAICEADQAQPVSAFRDVPEDASFADLQPGRLLSAARIGTLAAVSAEASEQQRGQTCGLQSMDEGSQLVAEIAAFGVRAAGQIAAGRILDCCAAPGGKTRVLAERNPASEVVAADASKRRLDEMRRRLETDPRAANIRFVRADAGILTEAGVPETGVPAASLPADAEEQAPPAIAGSFDRILCDVPCSGTGTLARNPEIRHKLRPENLPLFAARQRTILQASMQRLAPGGSVVYSTCSLEPEENEAVVAACLASSPAGEFRLVDMAGVLAELRDAGVLLPEAAEMLSQTALQAGCLRTLPGVHPCDGFFAAVIERV